MHRSLFLARLIGPTFAAIALGMLFNLDMYESMTAEALLPGVYSICPVDCHCSRAWPSST